MKMPKPVMIVKLCSLSLEESIIVESADLYFVINVPVSYPVTDMPIIT
jgi:hypothetical protein